MIGETTWAPEEVSALLKAAKAGKTNREIGEMLGRTHNMVSGKLNRLGFTSEERKARSPKSLEWTPERKARVRRQRQERRAVAKAKAAAPRSTSRPAVQITRPERQSPSVRASRSSDSIWHPRTCQFPIGDPQHEDFHFCGKPITADGRPYCDHHQAICTKRESKAA